MVAKNKTREKRGKVEVGKLKLKKETVRELTGSQQKQIKGGHYFNPNSPTDGCAATQCTRRASGCVT